MVGGLPGGQRGSGPLGAAQGPPPKRRRCHPPASFLGPCLDWTSLLNVEPVYEAHSRYAADGEALNVCERFPGLSPTLPWLQHRLLLVAGSRPGSQILEADAPRGPRRLRASPRLSLGTARARADSGSHGSAQPNYSEAAVGKEGDWQAEEAAAAYGEGAALRRSHMLPLNSSFALCALLGPCQRAHLLQEYLQSPTQK
uniref:Uncharacterized protein n=1 Tax=Rangifer tarandus platyrhynchus TaxID=3082113 RepID=A0ACB0FG82_RANTA|nr:unnamed protein product [Rangifer tarandus platyrhynchus]